MDPIINRLSSLLATVFVCLSVAVCCAGEEPVIKGGRFHFALPDLQDQLVTSDSLFKGKVAYVTLWGTWCPPCISEVPTLIELQKKYGEEGLVLVAIAFEKEDDVNSRRKRLREFIQKYGVNYLILDGGSTTDFSAALPMLENVGGLPIEILLDRSGNVVVCRNGYGYSEVWARKLDLELKTLLKRKAN